MVAAGVIVRVLNYEGGWGEIRVMFTKFWEAQRMPFLMWRRTNEKNRAKAVGRWQSNTKGRQLELQLFSLNSKPQEAESSW
jgi:hypothetical protein